MVAPNASGWPASVVGRRAVAADAAGPELLSPVTRDEAEQRARSGITFASTLYGAGIVRGDLDPELLAIISAVLEPLSAPNPGADGVERRTPARRRLDAMVEIMRHHLDCQQALDVRRPGAHLTVVTGAATLQGEPGGSAPDWGGVISGETTRRVACDATITPVTVGPPGQVLDVGRRTRTVTAPLWAALVVRDRHCAFPGCDTPTSRCDAHRIKHWADGGPTALTNHRRPNRPTRLRPTDLDRPTGGTPATTVVTGRLSMDDRSQRLSERRPPRSRARWRRRTAGGDGRSWSRGPPSSRATGRSSRAAGRSRTAP